MQPADAAFFMRLRLPASQALKAAGGREVRKAEATVNGADARISILGFDKPLREAADSVRSLWNLPAAGTDAFAPAIWLSRADGKTRQDVLLFQGGGAETCSAWLIESSAAQEAEPPDPRSGNPLPEAALKSCIEMKDSGSVLTLHEIPGSPSDGARAAEAGMASLGWEKVLSGDTVAYFAKDGRAAVAAAYRSGDTTKVAVLRAGR